MNSQLGIWTIGLCLAIATLLGCDNADSGQTDEALPATTAQEMAPASAAAYPEIPEEGPLSGMTDAHNVIRDQHDLPPLEWSGTLAAIADEWAEHLAITNDCMMEHRPSDWVTVEADGATFEQFGTYVNEMFIGENLFWSMQAPPPPTLEQTSTVVNAWASEIDFYDYDSNTCLPDQQCGHYTQIVWRDTTQVGCSYRVCDDLGSQLWVCNYFPAGNMVGVQPY